MIIWQLIFKIKKFQPMEGLKANSKTLVLIAIN